MGLSLPKVKQNLGERTFLFTGENFCNKLALDIVKSDKIQTFWKKFLLIITCNFYYILGFEM